MADAVDREYVHHKIVTKMLQGMADKSIMSWLRDEYPTANANTRRTWIDKAKDEIREAAACLESDKPLNLGLAQDRYLYVYYQALKESRFGEALRALDRLCTLQGIDVDRPVTNHNINIGSIDARRIEHMTTQELMRYAKAKLITHCDASDIIDVDVEAERDAD